VAFNLGVSPAIYVDGVRSGSAAGVWRDGESRTYVLSAAHVIDRVPPHTPIQWMHQGVVGGGQTVETALLWVPMDGGFLDAGLVSLDRPGPFGMTGSYPWASDVMSWSAINHLTSVVICGKSGVVQATFDRSLPAGQPFSEHRHGRLLQFRYDFGQTQPGDSGGAVIALPEGTLVGVHVAEHVEAGLEYAWAVPAVDIQEVFAHLRPGFEPRP
jgi:hypothetical protein